LPFMTIALVTALFRGRLSYPIDGLWFDSAVRGSALLIYSAVAVIYLRFVLGWLALRALLRRLYWHPTRGAYELLRASLPGEASERKKIATLEPRPSYIAAEVALQCARRIAAKTSDSTLEAAILATEESLVEAYGAENEPAVRGVEKILATR